MAVKTFTTGEVLTAADTNTYLANSGLVYISATSPSAAATPAIDGCFTSTYAHYLITYNLTTSLTGQYTAIRLRASGTPKAVNYDRANYVITTGGVLGADNSGTAQTEWVGGTQSTTLMSGYVYLFNPQVSGRTGMNWVGNYNGNAYYANGTQTETYQADGFQFFASGNAATYTGTIRVYGIRQA
jgi:hypothetical protein